jgi:4'-phosphopantetheinyl transferase
LRVAEGEAHVWYAWVDQCSSDDQLKSYRELLHEDEARRLDRFAFDYLKREYLVTRALCRTTLSLYADVDPAAWRFEVNAYGRPEIAEPALRVPLRFNLSNARSLVACVITRSADAGIDVEETDRHGDPLAIASHYFAPPELDSLFALPAGQQRLRFFTLWTLKESYIKARGMGLSIPLDAFAFDLDGKAPRIDFTAPIIDDAAHWQFEISQPGPEHCMAVGVRHAGRRPFHIEYACVMPRCETGVAL